jgi:hypothetical protein
MADVPACVHFRYDATFAELKENLREKDKEISELKISISEMEARKNREVQRLGDVEASYQVSSSPIRDVQSAHTCRNRTLNIHLLIPSANGHHARVGLPHVALGIGVGGWQTKLRDMREEMDMMRLQQEEGLRRKREEMDVRLILR